MKKVITSILVIILILGCVSCGLSHSSSKENNPNHTVDETMTNPKEDNMNNIESLKITINNKEYEATIEDNDTAKSFIALLPKTFSMQELNGNEKYIYMDNSLPSNPVKPDHIQSGDIMLFGDDCLVIFYKSFDTNYSYTKIGHITNLPDLGNGNITATFEKITQGADWL